MLCPHCEAHVMRYSEYTESPEKAEKSAVVANETSGTHPVDAVGNPVTVHGRDAAVGARIDYCKICDSICRVHTYWRYER